MPSIRRASTRLSTVLAPRILRSSTVPKAALPKLLGQLAAPCDEAASFWIGWFRRTHRGKRYEVRALKRVNCSVVHADGRPVQDSQGQPVSRRYVWEVSKAATARKPEWLLITWGIDDVAVWFQSFATLRAALSAYRQKPRPVLDHAERIAAAQAKGAGHA